MDLSGYVAAYTFAQIEDEVLVRREAVARHLAADLHSRNCCQSDCLLVLAPGCDVYGDVHEFDMGSRADCSRLADMVSSNH